MGQRGREERRRRGEERRREERGGGVHITEKMRVVVAYRITGVLDSGMARTCIRVLTKSKGWNMMVVQAPLEAPAMKEAAVLFPLDVDITRDWRVAGLPPGYVAS